MVYNFNNETVSVAINRTSPITNYSYDGQVYGVEFSVDSSKLYISTVSDFSLTLFDPARTYKLFQFRD